MQRNCTELTERLLKSLDKEYNVVDMGAVVDVITALEKTAITKEVLEITRLGKYINELRRKTTNDALAKRAKDLVRRWRDMVLPSSNQQQQHVSSNTAIAPPNPIIDNTSSHQTLNGTKPASPLIAARTIKPRSPVPGSAASRIKPQSPLMRDAITSKIISPALSLNSDSCSPNSTPNKLPIVTTNYKLNTAGSPKLSGTSNQNHSIEAVPRTHSSNKRLRKEDHFHNFQQHETTVNSTSRDELTGITIQAAKKLRINGDLNVNTNSQVPNSPSSSSSTRNELNVNSVLEPSLFSNTNSGSTPAAKVEPLPAPEGPKKRGRKKGSKSIKTQSLSEDRVKEKLASISRNPKLKTTHEILADIQVRNVTGAFGPTTTTTTTITTGQLKREPPTTEEVLRGSDINNRNLASNNNTRTKGLSGNRYESRLAPADSPATDVIGGSGTDHRMADSADGIKSERAGETEVPSTDAAIKEILSKLPPLDLDAIRWSDDESNHNHDHKNDDQDHKSSDPDSHKHIKIDDDTVSRLHNECIENLNGNFQDKLTTNSVKKDVVDDIEESVNKKMIGVYKRRVVDDDSEREFREWHEMLARPSYDGQILHILPYVIIN